jgi:thioredoxin 1
MAELTREYAGRIKFTRMDVASNRLVPSQYGITGTPTLILFKNGKTLDRITGFASKAEIEGHLRYLAGS